MKEKIKQNIAIPLNKNTIDREEKDKAIEVLESGYVTLGKNCFEFEDEFAEYMGVKNAIFVNSGSSANLLAFFALANPALQSGDKPQSIVGKEVIVPAVTWSTTIWPIIQAGAKPVFVDSDVDSLQLKYEQVEAAINENTAAICVVHILGNAAEIIKYKELADKHNLWLIEDTCESLGVKHQGKFVGTYGDVGTYSFFFSHHITTIEGGMVVTNDDELAELMRALRAHGWTRQLKNPEKYTEANPDLDPRFLFINTGFNLRPNEINAAIGKVQLKKLASYNKARHKVSEIWAKDLAKYSEYFRTVRVTEGTEASLFGFPIICKDKELRDRLQNYLEENGVETRPIICGNIAKQPALEYFDYKIADNLDDADKIMDCGLYWGNNPLMTEEEIAYLTNTIDRFFNS